MSLLKKVCISLFFFISIKSFSQELISDNSKIEEAFKLAVQTVDINTRHGIIAAGGDYGSEWTRDIAINCWNYVSLFRPVIAEKSLWSVTIHKDTISHQYWDKIIWVIAAYHHYQITGDKDFLKDAYKASVNTMHELETEVYDTRFGLFTGPSVFNDGIAAYPAPIYDSTNNSSFVLDHPNSKYIKCLSTNCVYYGAYQAIIKMAELLHEEEGQISQFKKHASNLKANILKNFYDTERNSLYYLIDNQGKTDQSQEALGISFAIIFEILNQEQAHKLVEKTTTSKFGITSIYPDFARYSSDKPGRHNNIIWPMVNGFFAKAAIVSGNFKTFSAELNSLTDLALDADKGDYNFREIYNPYTGVPDGGWQCNLHTGSCKCQTWSATAYLNMVINGLVGLRIEDNRMYFKPYLPDNISFIQLKQFKFHHSALQISVKGKGTKIKTFYLNGKKQTKYWIDSNLKGLNRIEIEMAS